MANTIIIDANNRAHAHSYANKLSVGQFRVEVIFGIMREVHRLIRENSDWTPLVLWDGRAQWRYDIYPEYKSGREEKKAGDPEAQERARTRESQIPYVRQALSWMGIPQMYAKNQEADDMAGYFSKRIADAGFLVRLISSDTDWSQLVDKNVQWHDPINEKLFTHVNYLNETGYKDGWAYIQGKALIGDTSDSIDGIPKIGVKTAAQILAEFGSVQNFFDQVDSGVFVPKLVKHKNLASPTGRQIYERNIKLMKLIDTPAPSKEDVVNIQANLNPQNLRALCEKLNFQSILRGWDDWMEPLLKRQGLK